jgi:hypothetical protein
VLVKLTAVIAAALVLAAAAAAATAPQGFYEAKRLEPAASFVADKPSRIYCSQTFGDWQQYAKANGTPSANGLTEIGGGQSELPSTVCAPLIDKLTRQPVSVYDFAASLLILVHESLHQRGSTDEGQTECDALHLMPRVAVKFFRVKAGKQLRAVMAQAWVAHRDTPAAYRSVC